MSVENTNASFKYYNPSQATYRALMYLGLKFNATYVKDYNVYFPSGIFVPTIF